MWPSYGPVHPCCLWWITCEKISFRKYMRLHGTINRKWHDDVIKWRHFPRYWPFVRGIHRSPVNFPHKGQWRGALMFSLIYVWISGWVNSLEAGDLRRYRSHYDVIVMESSPGPQFTVSGYFSHIQTVTTQIILQGELTHWGPEKMDAISQTTLSCAFCWMKILEFRLKCHWKLFPMNNIPALVQIMAWHRQGDKALPEPMMVSLLTHICVTRPQWVNQEPLYHHVDRRCYHISAPQIEKQNHCLG